VHVVYPGVDLARYAVPVSQAPAEEGEIVLLSLNRLKPEKNHALAIRALSLVRELVPARVFASIRLVVAGGFNAALIEDRQTLQQLRELSHELDLAPQITFRPSFPESERLRFLACCRCLVYTPADEHFGFGPIEAMAAGRAVVAAASGGPLETVRHEETGLLCPPAPEAFAAALARLILNPADAARMGLAGRRHVEERFSLAAFGARLGAVLDTLSPPAAANGLPA
jgi:alpha-1,3/alpha-1,6-mannosyltransferase